ncbi:MAG: sodium/solute symporter [Planctomycetaceae bacterium]
MWRTLLMFVIGVFVSSLTHPVRAASPVDDANTQSEEGHLEWRELPSLPNELGVAGPFVGVQEVGPNVSVLVVAGGANFPRPVWENGKQWTDKVHVLVRTGDEFAWHHGGQLPRPIAYGAAVSTSEGVVCIGGCDADHVSQEVFLLRWNGTTTEVVQYPPLPAPCAYAQAVVLGQTIYLLGGQSDLSLASATQSVWSLDLAQKTNPGEFQWKVLDNFPGVSRAYQMLVIQGDGYRDCLYMIGGRRESEGKTEFLRDVWKYNPVDRTWTQRRDAPREMMAGTAIGFGHSHILVLGAADAVNFDRVDELRDDHPGFPKEAFAYHTITDQWTSQGPTPLCQVTTIPVNWQGEIVIASGEVRPRVRTPALFAIIPRTGNKSFGAVNYTVLFGYLAATVGVGFYFARRNNDTDRYFRGGQSIPWWAAGCSIFATMLSSLTYTGIPAKAYAQDWVYAVGNFMIPFVAVLAAAIALPFYRRIDATSAYEYLERRFNRATRLFGSLSFTLFHVFRMGVVMSLTGLALAVATPLSPAQSVLLMGVLSMIYCTMGGIEAVIWSDTIQTVVLLGGAIVAVVVLLMGIDGGWEGMVLLAGESDKFHLANWHWDPTNQQVALWVIIVGSIAQNLSTYSADQAVVQRYMTTPDERLAARAIWTNALLTIPATLLFFGIGTALFAFYHSHPERLDLTIATDQVFPLFIAREMPIGIAGLLVAGIFAAAQSTVSTSMNSTATTIVTDFLRPLGCCRTEDGYLRAARVATLLLGVLGTALGLVFISPSITSLFDEFIKVVGLFMGVLGGLFLLGIFSRRANGEGALLGALTGTAVMFSLWKFTPIQGYLYTASGVTTCIIVGYFASLFFPTKAESIEGLTIDMIGDSKIGHSVPAELSNNGSSSGTT